MNSFQRFLFRYFCFMKPLKFIFDLYIFGNIHVALATFSLTKITLLAFGIAVDIVPWFVFFSTLLAYNFIRLYRRREINSWLYYWIETYRKLLYTIAFVSLLLLVYLVFKLNSYALLLLMPLAAITLFYVVPFKGNLSLRKLSGFKLFLIASSWAIVTVSLPVINYEFPLTKDVIIIFLQRVFFVAAITIPFDIRDLNYDQPSLKTLPQSFGVARAIHIGIILLMLFLGLNFLKEDPGQMLRTEFLVTLLSLFLLVRSTVGQHKYYSTFFVEAIPIFWMVLLLF